VRLPWQPQNQQALHHRQLDRIQCGHIRDADYYIGIEVGRTATAEHRVSVRALDVRAGEWVSGFGKSWTGLLTANELHALQERRIDESLRGLRVLPFSSGYPDLAASYLANNLSCLLRQQDEDDLVIHVQPLRSDHAGLRTLLGLIGNNLSRFREVRITDAREDAKYILRGEAHRIESGLYQVWVILHPRHSAEHLSGMDTATYVSIIPGGGGQQDRATVRKTYHGKPVIARMELVRRQHGGANMNLCGEPAQFDGGYGLNGADCRMLELSVDRAGQVFVFAHGVEAGIARLSGGTCPQRLKPLQAGLVSHTYVLPERTPAAREWRSVYAMAVSDRDLQQQATRLLGSLPDACSNAAGSRMDGTRLEAWLNELDRLIAANEMHVAWTARRLP
jgi:hypothetical protein